VADHAATCERLRALIQRFACSSSTDVLRSYVTVRSSDLHSKFYRVLNATFGNICSSLSQFTKWRLLSFGV